MSGAPDEADLHKAGKLPSDPKEGTKPVAQNVPRVHTVSDLLIESRKRAFDTTKLDVCTTGHYRLDAITGGIRKGFTWLFGADTSFGKSSWLICVTDENIKLGKKVLIVSSEDTEEVYGDRLMVRRAGVSATNFRDRKLDEAERALVDIAAQKAEHVPVFIDARRWCVEDLIPHLRKVIKEEGVDVVAFDYVQEFRSKKRWQDERIKYKEIASQLRHVAKDEKVAGLLFSQLTMTESTKIPTRANIRECRDIANASEVILIGFEPDKMIEVPGREPIQAGTKCLLIDKCKNGPRGGKLPMDWCSKTASFKRVLDPDAQRFADVVGDQFDNYGDNARYPDP